MSNMILKAEIVPNSNNQSIKHYCDDNQCLNLEGCLYNRHSNGKLRPNVIGKFTDYSTISRTVCTDYFPPSDTPILKTRESKGFEGDEATIKNNTTKEELEDISRIISIYIGDEPKEIIHNYNKPINIRRAKALGKCIQASLKDLEKLTEKLGIEEAIDHDEDGLDKLMDKR